jgi:hypothetical protein
MPTRIGAGSKLGEKASLPDTGLSHQRDRCRPTRLEFDEELVNRTELLGAADEVLGKKGHFASETSIEQGGRTT